MEVLNKAGVPSGPVNSVEDVFRDPKIQSQNMTIDVASPGSSIVRMLGFSIKFSVLPCAIRRPAPGLGEHSAEILAELGYTDAEVEA